MGKQQRAVEEAGRALDLADRIQDASLRGTTLNRLGAVHYSLGDFGRARECLREGLGLASGNQPLHLPVGTTFLPGVISRVWLALTEAETGSFPGGIEMAEEAIATARSADQPFSRFAALWSLGHVRLRHGDLAAAASALEEGLEIGETWNITNWYPVCAATLGHVRTLTGRHTEALTLLGDAVGRDLTRGVRLHHALRLAWFGEALLHDGRVDEARSRAAEALARAVAHAERGIQAWTLRLLAEIAAHPTASRAEEAQGYYQQALELAGQLGMRPLVAHCHLGLGTLYRRTGDGAKAQEHLTTAATMYREMDMGFWLAKAEAELGGGGVER
jgi:tetratricopeptide (TPR) repeat protein